MTWPAEPGPDDWFLEVLPEQTDKLFECVFIVLKCGAFPAHRCDLKMVSLKAHNFAGQFDFALKEGMSIVKKLNMDSFRSLLDTGPAAERECAECRANASEDDYLCIRCREHKQ